MIQNMLSELLLFSGCGYLLIGVNELLVDLIWFGLRVRALFRGGERFGW